MNTIRSAVTSFCTALSKQNQKLQYHEYQKLIATITSRGPQLFADPILLHTAAGSMLIQPQRTNNLLETFFRKLMRGYRKRNGFSSVEKILKTILIDTPLVMNLLIGEKVIWSSGLLNLMSSSILRFLSVPEKHHQAVKPAGYYRRITEKNGIIADRLFSA